MNNIEIHSDKLPDGRSSFHPHARIVGDFIYVSGIIARKKGIDQIPGVEYNDSGEIIGFDIEAQLIATIENLEIVLKECGSSLEKVVDITVFLTDIQRDFKKFNATYGRYFGHINPSRTTVEVSRFPSPVNIELKVIAIR
jgi:2-aminomuconate deaminase